MLLFASLVKIFVCKTTSSEKKASSLARSTKTNQWTLEGDEEMQCIVSTRYHPAVFSTSGTTVLGCPNKVIKMMVQHTFDFRQ